MKLSIHSQTSTVAQLKFGNGKAVSSTFYWAGDYCCMLGLKLIYVGPWDSEMRSALVAFVFVGESPATLSEMVSHKFLTMTF